MKPLGPEMGRFTEVEVEAMLSSSSARWPTPSTSVTWDRPSGLSRMFVSIYMC